MAHCPAMRKWMLVAVLVLAACGSDKTAVTPAATVATTTASPAAVPATTATTTTTTTRAATTTAGVTVNWANYAAGTQARIDGLDCPGLQREFDTAEANSTAQRNRTGESNVKLMEYIEAKRRAAKC